MLFHVSFVRFLAICLIWSGSMGLWSRPATADIRAIQFVPPQTEEDSDPIDRPRGGGSRPICTLSSPPDLKCVQRSMVALVPPSSARGLSRSATPMIWFFSPYASETPIQASFELSDQAGVLVWQESEILLPSQAGLFAYQIPSQAALKQGELYDWHFNVHLDPEQPSADVLLSARLIYQNPSEGLPASSPLSLEHIQALANQGFWYDTISGLAQVSRNHMSLWEDFLIQNGFPDLIKEPIHSPVNRSIS